jgi:hypothetical protein
VHVEIDSNVLIARITLYQSGECYLQAVNIASIDTVFENFLIVDENGLSCKIDDFLSFLKNAPP